MNKATLFLYLSVILSFTGKTQTDSMSTELFRHQPKLYIQDVKNTIISPLRWNSQQWSTALILTGTTGLCFVFDQSLQERLIMKPGTQGRKFTANFMDKTGSIPAGVFPCFALYSSSLFSKNLYDRETALMAFRAYLITGGFTSFVKLSTHRYRPDEIQPLNNWIWKGPSLKHQHLSFFSGHTSTWFSMATIFSKQYSDKPIVVISSWGLATLMGYSRIAANKHWTSDVLAGAITGWAIGELVFRSHQKRKNKMNLIITPAI